MEFYKEGFWNKNFNVYNIIVSGPYSITCRITTCHTYVVGSGVKIGHPKRTQIWKISDHLLWICPQNRDIFLIKINKFQEQYQNYQNYTINWIQIKQILHSWQIVITIDICLLHLHIYIMWALLSLFILFLLNLSSKKC